MRNLFTWSSSLGMKNQTVGKSPYHQINAQRINHTSLRNCEINTGKEVEKCVSHLYQKVTIIMIIIIIIIIIREDNENEDLIYYHNSIFQLITYLLQLVPQFLHSFACKF